MKIEEYIRETAKLECFLRMLLPANKSDKPFTEQVKYLVNGNQLDLDTAAEILITWEFRNMLASLPDASNTIPQEYIELLNRLIKRLWPKE